jgi:CheY-like chemotaxis protein
MTEHPLRGVHLLLVEDNDINQQIAVEVLQDAGIKVTVANNGREGVEAVFRQHFDGVLMDVQMPVLDGYSATREIRKDARFAQLPIIAMTANAMTGDREKSIDAGMTDYVTKPLDLDQLFTVLSRHIKRGHLGSETPPTVKNEAAPVRAPRKIGGLDEEAAVRRLGGDRAAYDRMLSRFRATYRGFGEKLRAAYQSGDMAQTAFLAHTLKGTSGDIGAKTVSLVAGEIEASCRGGTPQKVLIEGTIAVLDTLLRELARLEPDPAAHAPESHGVEDLLPQLIGMIDRKDTLAITLSHQLCEHLRADIAGETLLKLQSALEVSDFDAANAILPDLQAAIAATRTQ